MICVKRRAVSPNYCQIRCFNYRFSILVAKFIYLCVSLLFYLYFMLSFVLLIARWSVVGHEIRSVSRCKLPEPYVDPRLARRLAKGARAGRRDQKSCEILNLLFFFHWWLYLIHPQHTLIFVIGSLLPSSSFHFNHDSKDNLHLIKKLTPNSVEG